MKNLYELELGEVTIFADDNFLLTTALRVPGGWIFMSFNKENAIASSVFVPWKSEF